MARTGLNPQQIKDKAVELAASHMRRDGFNKVRLAEIARDLGISHAALYNHFSNKDALFDKVSENWLCDIDASLEKICFTDVAPIKRIHQWFIFLHRSKLQRVVDDPELYKAFDSAAANMKPFVKTHLKNMNTQMCFMIKEAMEKGVIKRQSVEEVATILFEATEAFHAPALVAWHSNEKREPLLEKILNVLIDGLNR
ncbi:MAG: AcrR family transcriptional regulator [Methylophaga sp.]|nr:MAG: AcrR family transcriptional regulator [Methylophaga sp.]